MTLRLQPGPRDDDNRWACCVHCHRCVCGCCDLGWHDEPCDLCQTTRWRQDVPVNPERLAAVLAMLVEDGHITPQGARIITLTNEHDRCGGCAGLGAHTRWCAAVHGARVHRLGTASDALDDCGDMVGASDPHLSALCWQLSAALRRAAEQASSRQQDPT